MLAISIQDIRIGLIGKSATGTSSAAKELLKMIGCIPYSNSGDFTRQLAAEHGMVIGPFVTYMKENPDLYLDRQIDERMRKAGIENGNGIFEGRLVPNFVDDVFNVLFVCEREVRGQRRHADLLEAARKKGLPFELTWEQVLELEERRDEEDRLRYIDIYGEEVILDERQYHLCVDTTPKSKPAKLIAEEILSAFEAWHNAGRVPGPFPRKDVGYVPGSTIMQLA